MSIQDQVGPILNGLPTNLPDTDPGETAEWLESLDGVIEHGGRNRARYVMLKLLERARERHVGVPSLTGTDYVNTIPADKEPPYPGDEDLERQIRRLLRWNAAITVHRAQRPGIGVGGHISTYASAATLYEVGMNHFFRGKDHPGGGDQVFFQGHASPGMYARAFLEGRLEEADLDGFRQEHSHIVDGKVRALPSYPHPHQMQNFWEFPTVSMGIGPMNAITDGDYQTFKANDGAYVREHFFGRDARTAAMVKDWTDDQIWALTRGGHDFHKVYAAYKAATEFTGAPTVILAHTIKGYFLGQHFAGRNATHQMKKMALDDLKAFRDRVHVPVSDAVLEADPYRPPYVKPGAEDPRMQYLQERRRALGGYVPERRGDRKFISLPGEKAYESVRKGSGKQEVATTMAFVRLLKDLMRDKAFAPRVVPIIPDEARTFGIDAFFPTIKIYNPGGQKYTPVDADLFLSYREATNGQILHTGINEAGSMAAFTAAGTSYATHGEPMVPIYVFYSMFGFQRTGDSMWAAGDQLARGFVIGATAGRTTLTGEGTQHMDGHSPVLASTNTAFAAYDPAYGYELAHIVRDGLHRMYGEKPEDIMYYLTVYNEPYVQPAEPENVDVEGILKGMYLLRPGSFDGVGQDARRAQILASGVGVPWALEAQQLLKDDYGVVADVWSVTSWGELRREGLAHDKARFNDPFGEHIPTWVESKLAGTQGPIVAVSDYMHAVPDLIRPWVPREYTTLGADGFGFSDTRAAARRYYNIDGPSIAVAVLQQLALKGEVPREWPLEAARRYRLDDVTAGASGKTGDSE